MSNKVDVLAVMEHFVHHGATSRDRINAERARAAVAELIEVCQSIQKYSDIPEVQLAFYAAIARVKGE